MWWRFSFPNKGVLNWHSFFSTSSCPDCWGPKGKIQGITKILTLTPWAAKPTPAPESPCTSVCISQHELDSLLLASWRSIPNWSMRELHDPSFQCWPGIITYILHTFYTPSSSKSRGPTHSQTASSPCFVSFLFKLCFCLEQEFLMNNWLGGHRELCVVS